MFVQVGNRIINTKHVVSVTIYEPGDTLPELRGTVDEGERAVVIVTASVGSTPRDNDPYEDIVLRGADAETFLEALPI